MDPVPYCYFEGAAPRRATPPSAVCAAFRAKGEASTLSRVTARRLAFWLAGALLVGGGAPASRAEDAPPASPAPEPAVERLLKEARETAAKDVTAAIPKFFAAIREALDYATKSAIR